MLRNFLRLSTADRRLVVEALPVVVWVRVALWVVPYRRVQGMVQTRSVVAPHAGIGHSARQLADAVRRASHLVPGATCLTQALAAQVLLGRAGHAARVWIGVARGTGASLDAHAWVEVGGTIVLGATPGREYVPLLALGAAGA